MNKAILMGRLTKDPEIRTTPTQVPVATFTLAVDRRFKTAGGEKQTDFIPVVAWRKNAEFAQKYFRKGMKIIVIGEIQIRTYEPDAGRKVYITEVIADEFDFAESKRESATPGMPEEPPIYPDDNISLPFDL